MQGDRTAALAAWADAKLARVGLRDEADVRRRQAGLWRRLTPVLAATPATARLAGRPLAEFPFVTAGEVRADFDRWNTLGLTALAARAAARASEAGGSGEVAPGVSAGFSTGTSGERGVFLASRAERARYVGQALARLIDAPSLIGGLRVALCLRADNQLYRDVGGGRVALRFFGLDTPAEERAGALAAFAPDVFIAPSHVLADLAARAEAGWRPPAFRRLYFGAEPMGEGERAWIEGALGCRPDPIYQATEGFLGAPCRHGALHLNEDALVVEREPAGGGRFRPIVTDLFRTTQPVVRLRLDDLLEPADQPCRCGSPLTAVKLVEGRIGDVWRWGGTVVRPREVTAAIEAALGPRAAWRAQAGPGGVRLETSTQAPAAVASIRALIRDVVPVEVGPLSSEMDGPKRRRVVWRP